MEWEAAIADTVVETHDRIVGKTWREAKRLHDETIAGSKAALTDTIRAFTALGASLLEARNDGVPLEMAVANSAEWHRLDQLVATGAQLSNTLADEPLAHVGQGYHRFRRYAPRMLRCLKIEAAPVAQPLVAAAAAIGKIRSSASADGSFLRPNSKWHRHLRTQEKGDDRLWEVAVLFHLRDAFRSGILARSFAPLWRSQAGAGADEYGTRKREVAVRSTRRAGWRIARCGWPPL